VPVAVLTAIIVPTVLYPGDGNSSTPRGTTRLCSPPWSRRRSAISAKNLFATIGAGVVAFLLLRWLLPI
jgi:branched-subunit amino acid transport protein